MAIAKSKQTAQEALHHFKTFLGKKRSELPWLNGKTKGFPDRVHGFYDCALGYSYISGLRPVIVSCHVARDYAKANKTWHRDIKKVQPGDAVIFDWSGKAKETDHIGMVDHVDIKKGTVTYVSADTGPVIPGIVTVNTVGMKWITGFGRLVEFATPASHVPVVNQDKRQSHSALVPAPVEAPHDVPVLATQTAVHDTPEKIATSSSSINVSVAK